MLRDSHHPAPNFWLTIAVAESSARPTSLYVIALYVIAFDLSINPEKLGLMDFDQTSE